jgi:hypothetical protein
MNEKFQETRTLASLGIKGLISLVGKSQIRHLNN